MITEKADFKKGFSGGTVIEGMDQLGKGQGGEGHGLCLFVIEFVKRQKKEEEGGGAD